MNYVWLIALPIRVVVYARIHIYNSKLWPNGTRNGCERIQTKCWKIAAHSFETNWKYFGRWIMTFCTGICFKSSAFRQSTTNHFWEFRKDPFRFSTKNFNWLQRMTTTKKPFETKTTQPMSHARNPKISWNVTFLCFFSRAINYIVIRSP